ncbi:Coenzyme F420 hydrogenase/dehydrogenase, beta subunit C-terminal domain [Chloroflexota bacterium]
MVNLGGMMPRSALLGVKEGKLVDSINTFLRDMLEKKMLDALLVPLEHPSKSIVNPALVWDPEKLKNANPLAPVMPVSTARIISSITKVATSKKRVGVVLRSCELRALIELVKLKQASLENIVLIGIDCFGTYSVTDYGKFCQETATPTEEFTKKIKSRDDTLLREACLVCEYPTPLNADLVIGLFGMDLEKNILIQATSAEGERILEALELKEITVKEVKKRETAITELIKTRVENKNKLFKEIQGKVTGVDHLLTTLAPCINCHNCRIACPLCYCKECFFDSPTFEWEADKYLGWAEKRGALKMPTDSLLFHLTRLNHMVASCVGCGLCQEACPNDVPVFPIFRMAGEKVQGTFGYIPGRNLEDELPLSVFREDELSEVGTE